MGASSQVRGQEENKKKYRLVVGCATEGDRGTVISDKSLLPIVI
jgi:hypothetical protein